MDTSHIQKRIINLVEVYKQLFPEEYKQACEAVIMLRQVQEDEFASVKGDHSGISPDRILHEIPEKLYMSFVQTLSAEELTYWKSKEGGRWFCKEFPQFSLTKV
jgi:hypothetical protein